jgi:hypothetical protein
LCVPLSYGWAQPTSRIWKICAIMGGIAIFASALFLLTNLPQTPEPLQVYRSTSWGMTLETACKFALGWLGGPVLRAIYPLILLPLAIFPLWLLVRFLRDAYRQRLAALVRWSDLTALLALSLLVTVGMARARAGFPDAWPSRYCALEVPIAVVAYLLLVRAGAPRTLLNGLALGMALSVGWALPQLMETFDYLRPRQEQLSSQLRAGREPLSVLAENYCDAVGWNRSYGINRLISWWERLRRSHISVFRQESTTGSCLFWHARFSGRVRSLTIVDDDWAVEWMGLQAASDGSPGSAIYEVDVPETGSYRLCCRCQAPQPGPGFGVAVDEGPISYHPVVGGKVYTPNLSSSLNLEAGKHRLTIIWPGARSRVDVFELNRE